MTGYRWISDSNSLTLDVGVNNFNVLLPACGKME